MIVTCDRRVSRNWRTRSLPALAELRQWMYRRSSPGWYSRRAWKARSLIETSSVVLPSRSRSRPAPRDSSATVRGWTNSSVRSVHVSVRRIRPSGSPCTVVAGPTWMTPRREVGTTKSSSWALPGVSAGSTKRAADRPTGSSTRIGSIGVRASLVTRIRPVAGSPTVTRRGSTSARMRTFVRPSASSRQIAKRTRAAAATMSSSVQPQRAPTNQQTTPRARIVQPSGETHPTTRATGRQTPSVWPATCPIERVSGWVTWRMPRLVVPATARARDADTDGPVGEPATGAPAPAGAAVRDGIRKRPPRRDGAASRSCWVMRSPCGPSIVRALLSASGRGALGRRGDVVEDLVDDLLDRRAGELRLRSQQQAVAEDRLGEHLDVVGHHVGAALARGPRLGAADVGEAATHRQAQLERGVAARLLGDAADVAEDRRVDVHLVGELAHLDDDVARDERAQRLGPVACLRVGEHRDGGLVVGVADARLHEEAVELRLGQAVGAGLLDGVLGRDDHERLTDRVRLAVDRDAALLHDLEQRGLGLRRGAVDLVGEHDGREDRARVELEGLLRRLVDRHAGDVAREQVGRELDAAVRALDRGREGAGELGLAGAGEVLEEHVALGEQAGQREARHVLLAQDGLLDVADQLVEGVREPGDLLLRDATGGGGGRHGCRSPVRCFIELGYAVWLGGGAPATFAGSAPWVLGRRVPSVGPGAGHGHRLVRIAEELARVVGPVRRSVR